MFVKSLFIKKREKKPKIVIMCVIVAVIIILAVILSVNIRNRKKTVDMSEFSSIDKICELATLKCYYHDVAEYEKQPDAIFKYGLFKYGYKKMWLEYDGIVTVGIDAGKIQVEKPDTNSVVRIYVPDAQILDVDADVNSMNEPITETGKLTNITSEEKSEAFSETQAAMRKNAEADDSILIQAKNNAKELLNQYVLNLGEQMGVQYKVEWLDKVSESKTNSEEEEK